MLQTIATTAEESIGYENNPGQVALIGELPPGAYKSLYQALEELGLEAVSIIPQRGRFILQLSGETEFMLIVAGEPAATADLCESVMEWATVPLILVGTVAGEDGLAAGLAAGAVDFLDYTWNSRLLAAKLEAMRRISSGQKERTTSIIRVRDLAIDLVEHRVTLGEKNVALTPTEFRLLTCLARHAGSVVPAPLLLSEAQSYDCDDQEAQEIVKVHMHRLRQKIEDDPTRPSYIVNVRGIGYMLERRGAV